MNKCADDVRFIEITADDFDEIYAIEKQAYPIPWSEKIMRSMLVGNEYKIQMISCGRIVGYCFVMVVLDEATILNITVNPGDQGHGFGRQLLRYVKAALVEKGVSSIFLEVRQSNKKAILLYESENFNEIDVRKNYYPTAKGREDAVIMVCSLMY